jgi:hypothetical protein
MIGSVLSHGVRAPYGYLTPKLAPWLRAALRSPLPRQWQRARPSFGVAAVAGARSPIVTSSRRLEPSNQLGPGAVVVRNQEGGIYVLLLVALAILAIIAFGVGFTVHWLFIVAAVIALVWLISLLAGGVGGRSRGAWW